MKVCVCVRAGRRERGADWTECRAGELSCVCFKSRRSLPIAAKHKELQRETSAGGLLARPSAHRERAEEGLTCRKQPVKETDFTHTILHLYPHEDI